MTEIITELAGEEKPRPLFLNFTVLDGKTAARAIARQTRPAFLCGILFIFCALVPLAVAVYGVMKPETEISTEGAVGFAVFFGLLGALSLILSLGGRRTAEKTAALGRPKIVFECYENCFTADVRRGESEFCTFTRGDWFRISAVREYADMWQILYEGAVFTLLKSGMREGNAEELSAFLRRKAGVKYKLKFKNR